MDIYVFDHICVCKVHWIHGDFVYIFTYRPIDTHIYLYRYIDIHLDMYIYKCIYRDISICLKIHMYVKYIGYTEILYVCSRIDI